MNLSAAIANSLWTASNVPALIHFRRALNRPAETQLQLLRDYLVRNADSAYGKAHDFGRHPVITMNSPSVFRLRITTTSNRGLSVFAAEKKRC